MSQSNQRPYYEAYEDRYQVAHRNGVSWASREPTPIVGQVLRKYGIRKTDALLEIGCGEGRDAIPLLQAGYGLYATDLSPEAIRYCRSLDPDHRECYGCLDCVGGSHDRVYDFVYAVAVLHMLVPDEDRQAFYRFIRDHLAAQGLALICTMGDGEHEMASDIRTAFTLQPRNHASGTLLVAGTSCRMVSFPTFRRELEENGLEILETGLTESMPDFNSLLYAVARKRP